MNLRLIARRLCPAFKAHIVSVLGHGLPVSSKVLMRVAARRTEAQQFAAWSRSLE